MQRYLLLSILVFSLTLYWIDSIAASNIPDHERRALLDLYSSTGGEHWTWHGESGHWNFSDSSVDPCDAEDRWQGVICINSTTSRNVNIISLGSYNLNGTIPASIGNFSELVVLGLEYNALIGGVPSSVGALRKLRALGLFSNQLSGTIPPSFDDLTDLQFLYLSNNSFVGSIPPLQHLGNLTHLSLNGNALSGTIPDSLGSLVNLQTILLGENLLTGTIPSSLSILTGLSYLLLEENQLVGTIPNDFGRLTKLTVLSLFSNHLSGSIPSSVGYLKALQVLSVSNNALTGTIPESVGAYTMLQVLAASDNALTGSIPISLGRNSMLKVLFLSDNLLSGTIPPSAVGIRSLESVKLDSNCLEGTVPSTLSTLTNLTTLLLQNNQLSGSLSEVFDHWTQGSLGIVQVSDNALTGGYPDQLFLLPRLTSFVAVANCFDAELSDAICRSNSLQSLVLDGAQSAPSCRRVFIPGLFSSYRSRDDTNGRIPLCVFNMSSLQELHLSGNGYTGSLPSEISPALVDLSLSHNYLTGTIPHSIQNAQWKDLRISYNLLLGTLISDFPSNNINEAGSQQYSTISYRNNRLSGHIPSMFRDTLNATIMGGNLFDCRYDRRDVPRHDDQPNTPCGSNEFNISYFIWLTLVMASIAMGALLYFQHPSVAFIRTKVISWIDVLHIISTEDDNRHWYLFNKVGHALCKLSLLVTLYCLLLLCPLYLVLHLFYATHTYTYAWIVSASYLTGLVPFCLVLVAWIALGLLFVWEATSISAEIKDVYSGIHGRLDDSSHSEPETRVGTEECDSIQSSSPLSIVQHEAQHGCAKIADDVNDELYGNIPKSNAVELANISSAIADTSSVTRIDRLEDQHPHDVPQSSDDVSSSCLDGWRERVVSVGLIVSINAVAVFGVNTAYVYIALSSSQTALVLSQLLLSAFKMLWSNKCLPFIIRRVSNWAANSCRTRGRDQQLHKTTLPQFTSLYLLIMLLNNIAIPVLVVSVQSSACFYNFFINADAEQGYYRYSECQNIEFAPISDTVNCSAYGYSYGQTNINLPYRYSYQCSSSFTTYYAPTYVFLCVIIVFIKPVAQLVVEHLRQHQSSIAASLPLSRGGGGHCWIGIGAVTDLYDPTVVLVTVLSLVGMGMTFGVVYPPLCPAFLLAILSEWFGAQAALGRHFLSGISRSQQLVLVRQLLREYRGVSYFGDLYNACWMLLAASFTFYTLFLFDILDRKVALRQSYPVLFVVPLLPVSWFILYEIYMKGQCRRSDEEAIARDKALGSSAHTARSLASTARSTQSFVVEMDDIYRKRDSEKDLQLVDSRVQCPSRRLGQLNSRDITNGTEIEETLNALHPFDLEQL